ncbi:hypothetical protein [Nocardioides sp. MH1]|uniref:hypothetical protein n=1 Tax=Nocardioides sp. MH1 TaxID=3242490 RepID=UPI0035222A0F
MSDWIPLLVRREDYPELAAVVAEREAGRPDAQPISVVAAPEATAAVATPVPQGEAAELARHVPWSATDLERLAASPALTAHRWKAAIDACAAAPGVFIPTDRLALLIGVRTEDWADAEIGMRRHLRAQYPDVPGLPLATATGTTLLRDDDQLWWAVTETQARRWTEIRGSMPRSRRPRAPLPVASALD